MKSWPKGWHRKSGRTGIWYRVPKGTRHLWDNKLRFKLGETEAQAYKMWFSRNVPTDEAEEVTVEVLLDQFMAEYVAVYLKESTFESYAHYIKPLKKVFGHLHPSVIRPIDVFQYQTYRPKSSGNREASVLSSALQFAIEKGCVDSNPLQGVITKRGKRREQSRRRVPSQEDISALIEIQPELAGHIALKRITGMRKGQLLNINLTDDWNGSELFVPGTKGGNDTIYKGDALVEVINLILGDRLPTGPLFLTSRRPRKPVTVSGFNSMWQRAMRKFVAKGGERFNEHDIRKLVANGADNLIHAQALLGHTSPKITASVYRIKPVETDVL